MFVVDTNVLSELRRQGKADARVASWARAIAPGHLYLSAVTILELETGALLLRRRDPAAGMVLKMWIHTRILPSFTGRILPVDTEVALRCAELHVPDRRAERDALIAATALVHGFTVATRNVREFAAMGVRLVNPWD